MSTGIKNMFGWCGYFFFRVTDFFDSTVLFFELKSNDDYYSIYNKKYEQKIIEKIIKMKNYKLSILTYIS